MTPAATTWPVVEVFGPTIQGEGPLAGARTMFIRFGGCDYRCSWCDSLYAVLPEHWSRTAPRLGVDEIMDSLAEIDSDTPWVTLSGGNPAMYDLAPLVAALQERGLKVAVETQGSVWREWLMWVDCLVLSPKPPSSGMATESHAEAWNRFCQRCVRTARRGTETAVKVVVFDDEDYEWAVLVLTAARAGWGRYLSVGTTPPGEAELGDDTKLAVCDRWTWLADKVARDERLGDVRVLPQLHVLAWAHARAV